MGRRGQRGGRDGSRRRSGAGSFTGPRLCHGRWRPRGAARPAFRPLLPASRRCHVARSFQPHRFLSTYRQDPGAENWWVLRQLAGISQQFPIRCSRGPVGVPIDLVRPRLPCEGSWEAQLQLTSRTGSAIPVRLDAHLVPARPAWARSATYLVTAISGPRDESEAPSSG